MGISSSKQKINKSFVSEVNIIEDIKSKYIMKKIFSLLYVNKKLELIIYNKKYQKIFKLDVNYYKQISGKYLNGERNGNGKEYDDNDKIIFEGKYINGKRNGKGKEYYDNGKLKFKGEYYKDQRI